MAQKNETHNKSGAQRPVKLSLSSGNNSVGMPYPWVQHGSVYAKGYVYGVSGIISGLALARLFEDVDDFSCFIKRMTELNGFFAVIIVTPSWIFAAVDRVCSTPLQYTSGDAIVVGDDYKGFVSGFTGMNEAAAEQYLVAGYTYGRGTILNGVEQILPGEAVALSRASRDLCREIYFQYDQVASSELQGLDHNTLMAKLHDVHLTIFERLVRSLDGRKAVVPLSGGYDSRLVVEMLAYFGHRNVLCVTWGKKDFHEVLVAQDVARKHGMSWVRVENSRSEWSEWYQSGKLAYELELCGALQTIPYVQDNVLIEHLLAKGLIDKECVFLSGNSGDFIEGGHITEVEDEQDLEALVAKISKKHQRLLSIKNPNGPLNVLRGQAEAYLARRGDLAGFDEHWEWMERQSKFVTKSIKPFEARGFEWRMPFWDFELMEFWARVPRSVKSGRALFCAYAHKYMNKSTAAANPAQGLARRYYDVMANGRYGAYSPDRGPLGLLHSSATLATREEVSSMVRHRPIALTRINGLVALDTLNRIIKECTEVSWVRGGEKATSAITVTR